MQSDAAAAPGAFPPSTLARLLDITVSYFHRLVREGVLPQGSGGRYPLAPTVRAYIRFLRQTGAMQEHDPEKLEPFQRKAHYAAAMVKLQLERECADLVPRADVGREWRHMVKVVGAGMASIPDLLQREARATPRQIEIVGAVLDRIRSQVAQLDQGRV